ncbi:MAG: hypothetical protein LBU06_04190, partial [Desulfovibrio sp.]|nr:hypothetical protein [Desulfovibrio sp.]
MRQRTLLIISHMPTFFSEQLPYIRLCLESGRFKPVVQFAVAEAYVLPQIATCLSLGIEVYNTDGVRITEAPGAAGENIQAELPVTIEDTGKYPSTSAALLTACRKRVAYRMRRTADKVLRLSCRVFRCPERMINPMPKWRSLRHRGKVTRRLLRETRPDLVLLGGDLAHHDTSAAIAEARKAGIPA